MSDESINAGVEAAPEPRIQRPPRTLVDHLYEAGQSIRDQEEAYRSLEAAVCDNLLMLRTAMGKQEQSIQQLTEYCVRKLTTEGQVTEEADPGL